MSRQKSPWSTVLMASIAAIFTLALVIYPKQGFEAGLTGLHLFWDTVFPSLLPFFILSELMLGLGIVRAFGILLEPLMRPLFSVPGAGAFALSMGLAAGYPMDAVITARFRETNQCTRIEGERLLAFTNTADPLFMFGAVAVGMFKSPELGALLAIAHYASAFVVGVLFKFWGRKSDSTPKSADQALDKHGFILKRAYLAMLRAREEDGRPFGRLLGNAVTESIQTLLMICGFIVFFAVLIQILHLSGLMTLIGWPVGLIYKLFGIHQSLVNPTLAGLMEIDIGTSQTAMVAAPILQKFALASAIIAWSGLAVHAQVASVLVNTDIRMRPYFLARFLHGILAALFTVVFYALGLGKTAAHAFASIVPTYAAMRDASSGANFLHVMYTGLSTWLSCLGALVIASLAVWLFQRSGGTRLRPRLGPKL